LRAEQPAELTYTPAMTQTAPYGTWASPIDAADVVAGHVSYLEIAYDDGQLYWLELRPSEGGRQVLMRRDRSGRIEELTPEPINVRTRVHEYGGGSFTVGHGRVVYSDHDDQRIYSIEDGNPRPVTEAPDRPRSVRFADGRLVDANTLVCVREAHIGAVEPVNELVTVRLDDGRVDVIARGRDFYAAPRLAGDGRIAWLEWDHPNMPWDGTELKVGSLGVGELHDVRHVAGGPEESIFQPEWSPDGDLFFASDRTGWWNLYRWGGQAVTPVLQRQADFGVPAWFFGRSTYGYCSGGRIIASYWEDGLQRLDLIESGSATPRADHEHSSHEYLVTDGASTAWFVGVGPNVPMRLVEMDVDRGLQTVVSSNSVPVDESYISPGRIVTFPTGDGEEAYAVFYPPANPDFEAPAGELPPLIVQVHGGPTSHVVPALRTAFLYWTTRGFAVVDVNYRGSTGFGREYRNRLHGDWGLVDVEDCMAAARYLAAEGEVDRDRLAITGGSAGGFTTLAALAFEDDFAAGASYYGVADLGLLAEHTHKFESRYLDRLVAPEQMKERSPLYSAHSISVPVVLFQGLDDKVVPPEQAEVIAEALASAGIPHAHITYEGEDHGFRKAENIIHSLESELAFYGEVFGFSPAGDLPGVNLRGG
jgi:dipeptidyl aminopeptidase/acylaminoacyl peptidase